MNLVSLFFNIFFFNLLFSFFFFLEDTYYRTPKGDAKATALMKKYKMPFDWSLLIYRLPEGLTRPLDIEHLKLSTEENNAANLLHQQLMNTLELN
jgi:hypothetical protein